MSEPRQTLAPDRASVWRGLHTARTNMDGGPGWRPPSGELLEGVWQTIRFGSKSGALVRNSTRRFRGRGFYTPALFLSLQFPRIVFSGSWVSENEPSRQFGE